MQFISRGDIHARVKALGASATAVQTEIHLCACSILDHTREHGDYTAGEALMNALPNGQRVKALAAWFREFSNGKLSFKKDEGGTWVGDLSKKRADEDFRIDDACETSFADLTSEKAPTQITVKALIKMLSNRANDDEINSDGSPKVTAEARAVAKRLLTVVRDEKLAEIKAA